MGLNNTIVGSSVTQANLVDRSGTITTNNTSQQVAAANPNRTYFFFENVSNAAMWVNFGSAATLTQPSILVSANGGSFVFEGPTVSSDAVFVICANAGKAFTAKEAP